MQNIDRENFDDEALIRQIRQNFPRQTFAPYGTFNCMFIIFLTAGCFVDFAGELCPLWF